MPPTCLIFFIALEIRKAPQHRLCCLAWSCPYLASSISYCTCQLFLLQSHWHSRSSYELWPLLPRMLAHSFLILGYSLHPSLTFLIPTQVAPPRQSYFLIIYILITIAPSLRQPTQFQFYTFCVFGYLINGCFSN